MWQTIGQSKILGFLERALKQGTLSHASLLVGPPQIGKMTLAMDLAMALNCTAEPNARPCRECASCLKIAGGKHADVQIIGLNLGSTTDSAKERTEIGIDQVNEALHTASLPPFEGKQRVYIFDEAEKLSMEAANRLLKTLEEPASKITFILLTSNVRLVPATVISRCQRWNLSRLKTSEIEADLIKRWQVEPARARLISRLSYGCPGWAIEAVQKSDLLEERQDKFMKMQELIKSDFSQRFAVASQLALQFGKKREAVYETLDTWAGWWRDILLVKTGCSDNIVSIDFNSALSEMAGAYSLAQIKSAIEGITKAEEQLKLNANSHLALESLMLNLPRMGANKVLRSQIEVQNA